MRYLTWPVARGHETIKLLLHAMAQATAPSFVTWSHTDQKLFAQGLFRLSVEQCLCDVGDIFILQRGAKGFFHFRNFRCPGRQR